MGPASLSRTRLHAFLSRSHTEARSHRGFRSREFLLARFSVLCDLVALCEHSWLDWWTGDILKSQQLFFRWLHAFLSRSHTEARSHRGFRSREFLLARFSVLCDLVALCEHSWLDWWTGDILKFQQLFFRWLHAFLSRSHTEARSHRGFRSREFLLALFSVLCDLSGCV
jgi:hypothetical protein